MNAVLPKMNLLDMANCDVIRFLVSCLPVARKEGEQEKSFNELDFATEPSPSPWKGFVVQTNKIFERVLWVLLSFSDKITNRYWTTVLKLSECQIPN
jgi:hypothetical protein